MFETYDKFKAKNIMTYKILWKLEDNAYDIELLPGLDVYLTFNISDLFDYHEGGSDVDLRMLISIKKPTAVEKIQNARGKVNQRKSWWCGKEKQIWEVFGS